MKTKLLLLALALAVFTASAQTNAGVTLTPDQVAKLDNSINSLIPLIPAQYQGAIASAIAILGLLAMLGRVLVGWRNNGLFGAIAGLFAGTNTPATVNTAPPIPPAPPVGPGAVRPGDPVKGATLLRQPLFALFAILVSLGVATAPARAETVPNFLADTYKWVTAVNTNYDWTNVQYQAESGYKNTTSGAPAAFVGATRNFGAFEMGAEFQILANSATVQQAELRLGWQIYKNHDVKISAALLAGYDMNNSSAIIEPELRVTKLLTVNTYTFFSYSLPWETVGKFNSPGQLRTGFGIGF